MNLADLRRQIPELEGLDDASAVDAIQQAYYPDLDRQQIADRLGVKFAPAQTPAQSRGLMRGAADMGIEALSGVARGVKFTADAFGADNAVSRVAGTVDTIAREYLSAQAQQDDKRISEIMATAEDAGIWDQVKAAAEAFSVAPGRMAVNALGTSAPTIAAAMLPGVGQLGALGRVGALAGMGAAQGAGTIKGSIYERVKAEHERAGATPEDAAEAALRAQEYGGENAGNIAGGAALGAAASSTGAQPILARLLSRQAAAQGAERGMLASAGMGVLKETPLEAAQGGQEQYAGNIALQGEGFDTPTWRGVAGNAALEGLAAAPMGGITGAMDRRAPAAASQVQAEIATRRLAEADNVPDMIGAAEDLAMAPLTQPMQFDGDGIGMPADATPRQRNAELIGEIRQLDPEQQAEAMGLLSAAGNMRAPGHVRRFAQNRLDELLQPVRQIPVGEVTEDEIVPVGEAQELSMSDATGQILRPPEPGQWLKPGQRIPTGEATEMRPEPAVARKARKIPAGEATELDVERIEPTDLLTQDEKPYGTRSGAAVRATREGLPPSSVVEVPGGYVVRKENKSEPVPDVDRVAPVFAGPADGRSADAGGSLGDAGPDLDGAGRRGGSPVASAGSGVPAVAVGAGGQPDAALSDDLPTLKKQWAEAVRANDNALAKRINDRIVELKKNPEQRTASPSAESPPPAVSDSGDGGVATTQAGGAPERPAPPKAEDYPNAASYHAAVTAFRAANPVTRPANPVTPGRDRRAEIKRELEALQEKYTKRMNRKDSMAPPAIKADALSGIARQMDKLDAELKALDAAPATPLKDRVDAKRQQPDALRDELRKVEDEILRAVPAKFTSGGGDIEAAMKRREVPAELKQRRKALRDQIRAASQDAAAPAEKAPPQGRVPVAAAPEAFEHAGLRIYPGRVRVGDAIESRWAVQLPENKGTSKVMGDTLHRTHEEAKKAAEEHVARYEREQRDRAEMDRHEAERKAADEARKAANSGKSISERLADSRLDKMVSDNGEQMTRRQWVERKLADGLKPNTTQEDKIKPMSRSQFNRASNEEQRAHERRVKEAGKKDVYWIGDYEVTKVEHDYAEHLIQKPVDAVVEPEVQAQTPQTTPSQPAADAPTIRESRTVAEAAPTVKDSLPVAEPKPKRPPKSVRKKVKVTTSVFVEETGTFEQREIDADTALKALDEDISEMDAFMKCLKG